MFLLHLVGFKNIIISNFWMWCYSRIFFSIKEITVVVEFSSSHNKDPIRVPIGPHKEVFMFTSRQFFPLTKQVLISSGNKIMMEAELPEDVEDDGRGENQTFLNQQHPGNVLSRLHDLREREELCDVTIVVEGRAIKAHRAVLAATSQYFNAMFTRKMSERNQAKVGNPRRFASVYACALQKPKVLNKVWKCSDRWPCIQSIV